MDQTAWEGLSGVAMPCVGLLGAGEGADRVLLRAARPDVCTLCAHCAPVVKVRRYRGGRLGCQCLGDTHSMGQCGVGRGLGGVTICIRMLRFYTFFL